MKRGIVMTQSERKRIGRAAGLCDQPRFKARSRRRHPCGLAAGGARFAGEDDLDLGVLRDGSASAGKRAAEEVDSLGHPQACAAALSGRSWPNTRW